MKRTIIRLTRELYEPIEVVLKWEDEDGPTYEALQEAAIAMIRRNGLDVGDTIRVIEE